MESNPHYRIEELREHPKIRRVQYLYPKTNNGGDLYKIYFKKSTQKEVVDEILEPYSLRLTEQFGITEKTDFTIETIMTEIDIK